MILFINKKNVTIIPFNMCKQFCNLNNRKKNSKIFVVRSIVRDKIITLYVYYTVYSRRVL